jgi:hypothetical protein
MTYLVRESFEAVLRRDASSLGYITVMPGSTVTILGEAEQSGMVKILYQDRIATACMRDIREKARLVGGKTAG